MLFSVVIPTYNRRALLTRTIEAVQQQIFLDYEIIVVNDGSTDSTMEYLESITSDIHIIAGANRGAGAARNTGAHQAKGEYIAFLDSDDLWMPWTLSTFATLIAEYDYPAILSGSLLPFGDEEEVVKVDKLPEKATYFRDYFSAAASGYFVGSGMAALRRENFLKLGGFTEHRINAEDHDLILRMGAESGFVQVLQPVTLGWRRHQGSATMNFRPTLEGIRYLLEQERLGAYPGGHLRAEERRDIILRHVRPAALECLKQGMIQEAWSLYLDTFGWQAALGRWKFLSGFPVKAAIAGIRGLGQ